MNTYFDRKDTLHQLILKYPQALDLLISAGLDNLKNTAMLETLGKTITLEQALSIKKLNIDKVKITRELLGSINVFNDSIHMLNIF